MVCVKECFDEKWLIVDNFVDGSCLFDLFCLLCVHKYHRHEDFHWIYFEFALLSPCGSCHEKRARNKTKYLVLTHSSSRRRYRCSPRLTQAQTETHEYLYDSRWILFLLRTCYKRSCSNSPKRNRSIRSLRECYPTVLRYDNHFLFDVQFQITCLARVFHYRSPRYNKHVERTIEWSTSSSQLKENCVDQERCNR